MLASSCSRKLGLTAIQIETATVIPGNGQVQTFFGCRNFRDFILPVFREIFDSANQAALRDDFDLSSVFMGKNKRMKKLLTDPIPRSAPWPQQTEAPRVKEESAAAEAP